MRIVRDVEHHDGSSRHDLEAPRQAHACEAFSNRLSNHRKTIAERF